MLRSWKNMVVSACAVFVFTSTYAHAKPEHPGANAELSDAEQITLYEQTIYTRRGLGDMSYYASLTHPNYTGWPPMMKRPMSMSAMPGGNSSAASQATAKRLLGEQIDFYPMEVVFAHPKFAMSYFVGHRVRKGGTKEPSDEYFDNIHIWVKEDDGLWYLMGGMARLMPSEDRDYLLQSN